MDSVEHSSQQLHSLERSAPLHGSPPTERARVPSEVSDKELHGACGV